jgi:hypothetical protein
MIITTIIFYRKKTYRHDRDGQFARGDDGRFSSSNGGALKFSMKIFHQGYPGRGFQWLRRYPS